MDVGNAYTLFHYNNELEPKLMKYCAIVKTSQKDNKIVLIVNNFNCNVKISHWLDADSL
jgi:hypothetical protein